jgi:hypothetical protein
MATNTKTTGIVNGKMVATAKDHRLPRDETHIKINSSATNEDDRTCVIASSPTHEAPETATEMNPTG